MTSGSSWTSKLFPYLRGFKERAAGPNTIEYKIGEIFGEIKNRFQSGYNLRDVIDIIDGLQFRSQTEKHELSYLYEAKIKNMGNAGRNGGEYYTPRPLIRAMVKVVDPRIGERIYDGAVGSAGFLCEAFEYLSAKPGLTTSDLETLQTRTFYGKEKKSLAYVIGIMNMILHGIEAPNILHTNTLAENLADIQEKDRYDVVSPIRRSVARSGMRSSRTSPSRPARPRTSSSSTSSSREGRWTRRHRHQEHVPEQHGQRLGQPAEAPAGELQPPHRAGSAQRRVPGRGREDRGALLREGCPNPEDLVLPAPAGPQHGEDEPVQRRRPCRLRRLQKTSGNSPRSWSVDASSIDAVRLRPLRQKPARDRVVAASEPGRDPRRDRGPRRGERRGPSADPGAAVKAAGALLHSGESSAEPKRVSGRGDLAAGAVARACKGSQER